jgi:hypothetical protein
LNYENLERFQGSAALRSEIYDKVFEGEVECGTLEEVYQMFNLDHPDGYRGRSLSVSDVVEVVGEEESTFHFCDSIGFREVDFDPDMTEPLKEKKILPGGYPSFPGITVSMFRNGTITIIPYLYIIVKHFFKLF